MKTLKKHDEEEFILIINLNTFGSSELLQIKPVVVSKLFQMTFPNYLKA